MTALGNASKQFAPQAFVFARAALAAVTLGLLETFGSPRGRRCLAVGALLGGGVLAVLRPPVRVVPTRRGGRAESTASPAASPWFPRGRR